MDAIFCTTPFQILSAFSIALSVSTPVDLYIIRQFRRADQIAERVKNTNVFHAVRLVDETALKKKYIRGRKGLAGRLMLGISYLSAGKIAKEVLIPGAVYSRMYCSNKEFICRLVYIHLSQTCNIELVGCEDGVGTYVSLNTFLPGKADHLVRFLLFGKKCNGLVSEMLVYMPDLFHKMMPPVSFPVKQMPDVWKKESARDRIDTIFSYDDSASISESVILIDTMLNEVRFMDGQKELLLKIYDEIFQAFPHDRLVVKRHPRDMTPERPGIKYYKHSEVPFECICLNNPMESKVLIALSSTAVIQPKVLTDNEPVVILLNRIVKTQGPSIDARLHFYETVGTLYKNKERFFMPKDTEELTKALDYARKYIGSDKEND